MWILMGIVCLFISIVFKICIDDVNKVFLLICLSLIFFSLAIGAYSNVKEGDELGKQITAYKEENEKIVSLMKQVIEKCTGEIPEEEDILVLICSYPDLQSNITIMKQYNAYMSNQNAIKELEQKQEKLYQSKSNVYVGYFFKDLLNGLKEIFE